MSVLGQSYYLSCRTRIGRVTARAMLGALRRIGACRSFKLPLDALSLPGPATSGLMKLWSRLHWMGEDGMMPPDQLLAIYRLTYTWPGDGDVVELGSWTGLTTCYLATACASRGRGHVYAVDTFAGTKEGGTSYDAVARHGGTTWPAFRRRMREADLEGRVTALVGDTVEQAKAYPGNPIRVLLIDADHSFEGVRRDFEAWWPHVAPGGLIVFHDYAMPEAGVRRYVDEIVTRRDDVEVSPGCVHPNVFAVAKELGVRGEARVIREAVAEVSALCAATMSGAVRVGEGLAPVAGA
ncbi:MAG: class I SAM-dependent methyltransferase [Planctomycetia bacterium]|nr:class I SAM-dependent methyltransferase [Planctomycetia bacterium]MCK6463784.1 class I SAM-dependent methyltransferase [Phycisphaerae bacterium]